MSGLALLPATVLGEEEGWGIEEEFALLEEELSADQVVSASKHIQSIFWSPSAINVYTREDLRASGATTLAEFLRRVPGFDIYELKPSWPLVGARALTEKTNNLVLVLMDGREVNIELSGFALWNATCLDLDDIERVEVIRGPGSTLYGANAFSAVVSITTMRENPKTGGDVYLAGGVQGHRRLFGRVRGGHDLWGGKLSYSASAGAWGILSPSDNQDVTLDMVRARGYLRYQREHKLELSLHAGVANGDGWMYAHFGDLYLIGAFNPWFMAKLDLVVTETVRLKAQVYWVRYDCSFFWRVPYSAYDIWLADLLDFNWDSPTIDAQFQIDWQILDDLLFIGGANIRYTTLTSPELVLVDDDELRGAGFVHLQWSPWESMQLTGGLRFDANTDTDPVLSPRAVAVFRPWSGHAFRLGYGLAFRKPSHYENRWHPRAESYNPAVPEIVDKMNELVGNEDLINEKVHSFEAGWRAHFLEESLQVSVDAFYNLYRDSITFVIDLPLRMGLPNLSDATLRFENVGENVNALGGEAEVVYHPDQLWQVFGNLGIRYVLLQEQNIRKPNEPVVRANLGGRFLPDRGLFVDVALHFTSARSEISLDPDNLLNNPDLMPLGNQLHLIARLGFRLDLKDGRMMEAGLIVRSPLGLHYREYPGMRIPISLKTDTLTDFGGEVIRHRASLYLRGAF